MSVIKEFFKKSDIARSMYGKANCFFNASLVRVSPVLASKFFYRRTIGKKLDLDSPRTFNEKIHWLKLYWQNPLVVQGADKYGVRQYVEDCGCGETLNELYGVYNNVSEIDWDKLPQKFAIKTTNGCGTNIICDYKGKVNKEEVLKKLDDWLKIDYSLIAAEIHYSYITPRIICEKYIETDDGLLPNDYKLYCFNGEPKIILLISERESGEYKRKFFDLDWNEINLEKNNKNLNFQKPEKPKSLEKMIYYAEKLSKDFPFVRVDFYDEEIPIFGELTFTPAAGLASYFSEEAEKMLGDWIQLPEKYVRGYDSLY